MLWVTVGAFACSGLEGSPIGTSAAVDMPTGSGDGEVATTLPPDTRGDDAGETDAVTTNEPTTTGIAPDTDSTGGSTSGNTGLSDTSGGGVDDDSGTGTSGAMGSSGESGSGTDTGTDSGTDSGTGSGTDGGNA